MPAMPSTNTIMIALHLMIPIIMPIVIPEKQSSDASAMVPLDLCLRYKPQLHSFHIDQSGGFKDE
jgi:hypothetical protein